MLLGLGFEYVLSSLSIMICNELYRQMFGQHSTRHHGEREDSWNLTTKNGPLMKTIIKADVKASPCKARVRHEFRQRSVTDTVLCGLDALTVISNGKSTALTMFKLSPRTQLSREAQHGPVDSFHEHLGRSGKPVGRVGVEHDRLVHYYDRGSGCQCSREEAGGNSIQTG